ncbi:caspase family protein [Allocoleopsis franciscana]|uniref:Caspase domain-containing protein n=1 Tax=Allocoleopsis franciscana PCC 7113 TaxID=1173027 RepID=K9WQ08_9CYAN|nr:caspase family protein [Allocoleopsis franciscana]AFZ22263.1 Caspase domain-containing protein [Allocoleopsis franciscana PCC 7113]
MTEPTNSTSNLYALLIGIDCYLPNELPDGASYKSLKGCVRDITHVEAFLKRQFNLLSEQIYKLTASNVDGSSEPSEPPEQLPTYENIVGKFKEITEKAQPQDQVYIHYSGHGGRAVTNYPQLKGVKGIDEALVPTDIGLPTSRYLRDIELAALLQRMVDKGLVVTVVLDSCHSGGATRAGDSDIRGADANTVDTTPRPTESLVASVEELVKSWQNLTEETRSATALAGMLPEAKGYVLLAACRPSEYAYEYAFNGKERNGALTYWLLDSLSNRSPELTYKELYQRINAKVHSQFQQQTPMLLGEGNRLVFGSNEASLHYAVTVMQVDAAQNPVRVKFNAGLAQSIEEGSLFAIYSSGVRDFTQEDKQLALAEVTEIGATDAWAEIIKTRGTGEIEQGGCAVMLSAPVELIRGVRLVECTPENTKLEDLPPKEINQKAALQVVADALAGNGWVKVVADDTVADYQVSINKQGEYEICEPTGKPFPNLRPPLKVGESDTATQVVKRLVHLTKYKATEELDNFGTPLTKKLVVELIGKQANYRPGRRPSPQPFDDPSNPTVQAGETIFLRIRNESSQVLNVVVLDLSYDWSISQVDILTDGASFVPIDPGHEDKDPIALKMSLPEGYQEGTEIFKVFATVGQADFRWLTLPSLDQPIPPSGTRGLKAPRNPLEELLAAVGADDQPSTTKKAEVIADPSRGWTVKQVSIKVIAT